MSIETESSSIGEKRPFVAPQDAIAILGLVAGIYVLTQFVDDGPFTWHVAQPQFWHGIVGYSAFCLALYGCLTSLTGWARWAAAGLCLAVPLRFMGVDVALILAAVYFFGCAGIGGWIISVTSSRQAIDLEGFVEHFLVGASVVVVSVVVLGVALDLDATGSSVLAAGMVCLGVLVALWKKHYIEYLDGMRSPRFSRDGYAALSVVVGTMVFVVLRSNQYIYYDSAWYGLRPETVLFGSNGIYSDLGLTTQVHFYPKFFEVLVTPLLLLGDFSTVSAINTLLLALLAVSIYRLAEAAGATAFVSIIISALVVCTPALAGTAETAKGDVLSALLLSEILRHFRAFFSSQSFSRLGWIAFLCLVASTVRLHALPYLAIFFGFWASSLFILLFAKGAGRPIMSLDRRCFAIWVLFGVAVAVALHTRTLLLAGTPVVTNASTQALLEAFGFPLKFGVGQFTGANEPVGMLSGIADFWSIAVRPYMFEFHVFKWMGAIWIFFPVFVWYSLRREKKVSFFFSLLTLIALVLPLLLGLNSWQAPGGDGNYFTASVLAILILGIPLMNEWSGFGRVAALSAALAGSTAHILTSNWSTGLVVSEASIARLPFDKDQQVEKEMAAAGLAAVYRGLSACEKDLRVVGDLRLPQAFLLPIRYEPITELLWNNPEPMSTTAGIERLFRAIGPDLLIIQDGAELIGRLPSRAVRDVIRVAGVDLFPISEDGLACAQIMAVVEEQSVFPGESTGVFSSPKPLSSCSLDQVVEIAWTIEPPISGEVRIVVGDSFDSPLFALSAQSGRKETGPWAGPGVRFTAFSEVGDVVGSVTLSGPKCE
jgi:hypothetical protein